MDQFATFVDSQARQFETGSAEVKFEVPEDGGFYRNYYCADYASSDGGGHIIEMTPEEEVTFDPIEVSLGDMEMIVGRLVWNDVNITTNDQTLMADDFSEWFETWFDPDETNFDPDTRFSACIHSLRVEKDGVSVDMGTAPIVALADLLMRFESLGCQSLS
eukprot:gene35224-45131_t